MCLHQGIPAQYIFEGLADMAGLNLVFSGTRRSASFSVRGIDVVDALDLLAMQSAMFWQPLDNRTILVLEDTQQNRRDYDMHVVKTIYLPRTTSPQELTAMVNILRVALTV